MSYDPQNRKGDFSPGVGQFIVAYACLLRYARAGNCVRVIQNDPSVWPGSDRRMSSFLDEHACLRHTLSVCWRRLSSCKSSSNLVHRGGTIACQDVSYALVNRPFPSGDMYIYDIYISTIRICLCVHCACAWYLRSGRKVATKKIFNRKIRCHVSQYPLVRPWHTKLHANVL